MIKRAAQVLFVLVVLFAAIYLGDSAAFSLRKNPTGVVRVHPYTAVPRNDKREEIIFDDPHDENCANSLFPHQQMKPCWYLRSHPEKRTNL